MKNSQNGFIGLVIVIIVGLALLGGGTYVYLNKDKSNVSTNTDQEKKSIEITNSTQISPPSGFSAYSNKVFSNFFPNTWTTEEEVLSSSGCSARVYFVQNSVPKQTLINESTDYLHYLKNPGAVFSVSGGTNEGNSSFENLKKRLGDMEKDGRTIKQSFFQEEVVETNHKLDLNSSTPSLTYYFNFPKHNKKGIAKSLVFDGKFPQIVSIYYIAPEKDFSEDVFNSVASSAKNNLTTNRCDPFEGSSVKKDQKITIILPTSKIWSENNTYKVSWSTSLPTSSYSYFYVQLGSDVPKRVVSNPGSYGLWQVDKTKNSLEIKLNKNIINEQTNNSQNRNFDQIKNNFFVRVTAYDDKGTPPGQDDTVVATGDSSLFSVGAPTTISTPATNQQDQQDALQSIANIVASLTNFRGPAESVFGSDSGSYVSICSNGLINVSANSSFPILVNSILNAQGVSNQSNAGIVCVATKDKYAMEVSFKKYAVSTGAPSDPYLAGKHSYCVDSSGVSGDDTKYKIDKTNFSCKAQ
jgi:hypothetical protein